VEHAVPLEAGAWTDYFRDIGRDCGRLIATVTLLPDDRDGHGAGAGRTLRTIRYDRDRDALELGVGGGAGLGPALRYFIAAPRRIVIAESRGVIGLVIEDSSGDRTAVELRRVGEEARSPLVSLQTPAHSSPAYGA